MQIQIVRARALSISHKKASCEPGRTSAYSKDLRRVLQWYPVHRSPVDPQGWLVRRRDWALCGRITCWSCRINFLRYSIQLWVINAAWKWLSLLVYLLYLARLHDNLCLLDADWSENCCHVTSVLQILLQDLWKPLYVRSLVPSPTPSFLSLLSTVKRGTKQRRKAGRGTGNEASTYVRT